jgi:protein SCO1/2
VKRTLRNSVCALLLGLAGAGVAWAQDAPAAAAAGAQTAPEASASAEGKAPEADKDLSAFEDPEAMPGEAQADAVITDRAGTQLPLDATFDLSTGEKVRLGDLFQPGRPAILQFVYYRCPSLCTVTLDGMVELLGREDLGLVPGRDFDVITVSINPQETANLARLKKENYLEALGKPEVGEGWYFLSGSRAQIKALAGAAGFGYRFDTKLNEYAHGAGIFVITPEGVVSRTIMGAGYESETVRLSLIEAANGEIGSPMDQVLLYCYQFDPRTGRYTAQIMNIVRLTALLSVLILGGTVVTFFLQERRQRRAAEAATNDAARDEPAAAPVQGADA